MAARTKTTAKKPSRTTSSLHPGLGTSTRHEGIAKRKVGREGERMQPHNGEASTHPGEGGRCFRDLVCRMEIDPSQTEWQHLYEGETYYFCHLKFVWSVSYAGNPGRTRRDHDRLVGVVGRGKL